MYVMQRAAQPLFASLSISAMQIEKITGART
jgi:hypothetical protein